MFSYIYINNYIIYYNNIRYYIFNQFSFFLYLIFLIIVTFSVIFKTKNKLITYLYPKYSKGHSKMYNFISFFSSTQPLRFNYQIYFLQIFIESLLNFSNQFQVSDDSYHPLPGPYLSKVLFPLAHFIRSNVSGLLSTYMNDQPI